MKTLIALFVVFAPAAMADMTLVCSNVGGSVDVYIVPFRKELSFTHKSILLDHRKFTYRDQQIRITDYPERNSQVIVGANMNGLFRIECPDLDILTDRFYNEECLIEASVPEIGFFFGGDQGRAHTCRDIMHTAWSREETRRARHEDRMK